MLDMINAGEANYTIDVNNLIALSKILDNYRDYHDELIDLILNNYSLNTIYQLNDLSNGKNKLFVNRKIKEFYQNNRDIIEIIKKNTDFIKFNSLTIDTNGFIHTSGNLAYFYKYLNKNKDNLIIIDKVLNRIKKLGFDKLKLNEDLIFTKDCYYVDKNFNSNSQINYLDNMMAIPNYENNKVKYKTNGSSYMISLEPAFKNNFDYRKKIFLNKLNFNYKRLPESISFDMFKEIINLKNDIVDECNAVRNSVDLNVIYNDLSDKLNNSFKTVNDLDKVTNKDEIKNQLLVIKKEIELLYECVNNNDKSIVNELDLSEEILNDEKKLYLKRRESENYDLD